MELSFFTNRRAPKSPNGPMHNEQLLEERKIAAEEIREARERYELESSPLLEDEKRAADELDDAKKKAERMVATAKERLLSAQRRRQAAEDKRDAIIRSGETRLRATRSPRIPEFFNALDERRKSLRASEEWGTSKAGGQIPVASTANSVKAATLRILTIMRDELRALELEPLNDDELTARFRELEETIPRIEMRPLV
jgi:hypothetical protein